jgi:hypothetical protein
MGEVHTGLLHHSVAVSSTLATSLIDLVPGERPRSSERPIAHVLSPDLLTGVDCLLQTSSGGKVRAVGTAVSRAAITGGHVLQGSAYVALTRSEGNCRMPWSHYLSVPGVLETVGKVDWKRLAEGFLGGKQPAGHLDLGAIGSRAMDKIQGSTGLDHKTAFRSSRTKVRWVAIPSDAEDRFITFVIENSTTRTLRLAHSGADIRAKVDLFEDLALHDWLLTTLLTLIERSRIGSGTRSEVINRLRPAIDFLLHLWMPAARVDQALVDLWHALDQRPGLSRQWQINVERVRDQMALGTIERAELQLAREGEVVHGRQRIPGNPQ